MTIEKEYELAFDFLTSAILDSAPELTAQQLLELYKTCPKSFGELVGYLDGWAAAKGFGLDNDTRSWLNNKLKGE